MDSNSAKRDAQEGMGLTEDEADYFFSGDRTRTELFGFANFLLNGEVWFDRDGFDRDGFDRDGRDRDGFDRDGRDRDGNLLPLL
jgi:hypothetical protein